MHARTQARAGTGLSGESPARAAIHTGGRGDQDMQSVLTVSIRRRLSSSADLSLMSLLATQVLIWSRSRWSFLICVLRSSSDFSFCVWFVDDCILSYMLSKSSTPSETFFNVRSISASK